MKYRLLNEVLIEWNESSLEDSDNILLKTEDINDELNAMSVSRVPYKYWPIDREELEYVIIDKIKECEKYNKKVLDLRDIDISSENIENISGLFEIIYDLLEIPSDGVDKELKSVYFPEAINVSYWNVGRFSNFAHVFKELYKVKQIVGLETWDMSNAQSLAGMFSYCKELENIGNISKWKLKKVYNISFIFLHCHNLKPYKGLELNIFHNNPNPRWVFNKIGWANHSGLKDNDPNKLPPDGILKINKID